MPSAWIMIRNIVLRIVNVLAFLVLIVSDIRIGWPPNLPPTTYISSGNYLRGIWMLFRYNLLLGYHTYQFFPGAKVLIIDTVGWKFPVLTFIGGVYGSARLTENWLLAFISASLMFLWATFILFVINGRNSYPTGFNEVLWVYITLAVFHGCAIAMVFDNAFIAFGAGPRNEPGVLMAVLVFLSLLTHFVMVALYTLFFRNPSIELPAGLVIASVLFGIYETQRNEFVRLWAKVFFILTCLWIGTRLVVFAWYSRQRDESQENLGEREPLLAGGGSVGEP